MTDMDVDNGVVARDEMLEMDDESNTVSGLSDEEGEFDEDDWLRLSEEEALLARAELDDIQEHFQDDIDLLDTTMVAEYADEIFAHMERLEVSTN